MYTTYHKFNGRPNGFTFLLIKFLNVLYCDYVKNDFWIIDGLFLLFTLPCMHPKSKIYVHHLQIQICTTCGKKRTLGWTTIKDFRNLLYSSTQYGMMSATIVFEFICIWFGLSNFQLSSHLLMFMFSY